MIGGNITALMQVNVPGEKNAIGEAVSTWRDAAILKGWLDYISGNAQKTVYDAKIQETTHIFICDYLKLEDNITSENCRIKINGKLYNVLLIDDPMNLHQHLEIYLKYVGGQ